MSDWSLELQLKFLEAFQGEPVIWDPKHPSHKDKTKINDAWGRIENEIGKPIKELKNKKDSLMATYRGYCRKISASIKSGASSEDVYKPVWFAFELMDQFLNSVYSCGATINTKEVSEGSSSFKAIQQPSISIQNLGQKRQTPLEEKPSKKPKLLDIITERLQTPCSDSQIIAKVWALEFAKMRPDQQLYAKKFIDDIIFEGRLGNLHRNSVIINQCVPQCNQSLSGQPTVHEHSNLQSTISQLSTTSP